jgi:hypothetical protein
MSSLFIPCLGEIGARPVPSSVWRTFMHNFNNLKPFVWWDVYVCGLQDSKGPIRVNTQDMDT